LQFGEVAGRVLLVPFVIQLAAATSQVIAAVFDPAVERTSGRRWPKTGPRFSCPNPGAVPTASATRKGLCA
jgi:hypothetical protein